MKIGVFDSGRGGKVILDAIRERLPGYDYVFYADTKHVPYGDRSEEEIFALTERAVLTLFERGALITIIACNTASAQTLRALQETTLVRTYPDRRILGVIVPTVEELTVPTVREVLLIGTERTVRSGKYERELRARVGDHVHLTGVATPALVPLIEAGRMREAEECAVAVIRLYADTIDTLILGCTHYTVLTEHLRRTFPELRIVAQHEFIPAKLEDYLDRHHELTARLSQGGTCISIVTGAHSLVEW